MCFHSPSNSDLFYRILAWRREDRCSTPVRARYWVGSGLTAKPQGGVETGRRLIQASESCRRCGKTILPPHPLTPSPPRSFMVETPVSGEGVGDMGDGGSFAPPSPRNFLPSPCRFPWLRESTPAGGGARGGGSRGIRLRVVLATGMGLGRGTAGSGPGPSDLTALEPARMDGSPHQRAGEGKRRGWGGWLCREYLRPQRHRSHRCESTGR